MAPKHHWVQTDELQLVMKQLGSTSASNWPNKLSGNPEDSVPSDERNAAFKKGNELAASLADSANAIPATLGPLNLSDADRRAFVRSAIMLRDQARTLGRAARRHDVEEMQRQLDAIRSTCISCHTRFKDVSGSLPPRA